MVKRHYGIVNKDFKLVHFYYDVDEWELYDRKNDPNEMKNVYNDPNYKEIVKELTIELYELRKKYKDSKELDQKFLPNEKNKTLLIISFLTFNLIVSQDLKLPTIFSNNMIMQQQSVVSIWGWSKPNSKVSINVSWNKKKYKTKSNNSGEWLLKISTPKAGKLIKLVLALILI
jgi:hypothetical protein